MFADHHQFMMLIESLYQFGHQTIFRLLVIRLALDSHRHFYRVADKYRPDEPEPVISICHGGFIDHVGRKSDSDAEDEGAVGNPFFKRLRFTPFFVHMMRKKISGLTRMKDDIRLSHRAAGSLSALGNGKIFKM